MLKFKMLFLINIKSLWIRITSKYTHLEQHSLSLASDTSCVRCIAVQELYLVHCQLHVDVTQ